MGKSEDPTGHPHLEIEAKVRAVELMISTLLRVGVVLSIAIIIIGSLVTFAHHPEFSSSHHALTELVSVTADFPHTLGQVLQGLRQLEGRSIICVGLVLLIATPIMRVAISILAFFHQRDKTFVIITATVLALLILSFVLGRVE